MCCAAVPIFLGRPVPAAAVSITVLSTRAKPDRLAELGQYLREMAAEWTAAVADDGTGQPVRQA